MVELLEEYQRLKLNLGQAIKLDDIERVSELDKECTQLWNSLLSLKPNNNTDSRMLLTFLISQIAELTDYSQHVEQITEKIINLHDHKGSN